MEQYGIRIIHVSNSGLGVLDLSRRFSRLSMRDTDLGNLSDIHGADHERHRWLGRRASGHRRSNGVPGRNRPNGRLLGPEQRNFDLRDDETERDRAADDRCFQASARAP
jgi:hypothetical protein